MPLDDYSTPVGGGALRLKGSKVSKSKKKKKDKKLGGAVESAAEDAVVVKEKKQRMGKEKEKPQEEEDNKEDKSEDRRVHKTEAELRFEEARRQKFLELQKNAEAHPELLKTHKERVEEMNVFLSKLSEHNDMPKIGPG